VEGVVGIAGLSGTILNLLSALVSGFSTGCTSCTWDESCAKAKLDEIKTNAAVKTIFRMINTS